MNLPRLSTVSALIFLAASTAAYSASPEYLVPTATISLKGVPGKLDHLAVDSKGERLFVANKPNNTLDIIDLKTGKLVKQIEGQGKVSGVSFASELDMIYVGNGAGYCNAFDGKTYERVFSTPAAGADNVHYHSGNKMLYVGHDEVLSELDAKTGEIKSAIALPGAVHGFKIDKKAGKIYAVLTKASMVAVIDIAKHEVTNRFPITLSDAGSPIAQDAKNGLLFVGCAKLKPMVVVLDANTGKEISQVTIPPGIDDLHFDSKRNRLYASCADSALVVIEKVGDKYEVVAKLDTPKNSRTCIWSKGKLFLGVPKQDGKDGPEVWIFEARPVEGQVTNGKSN
jgi:DNA-binding beta-propeller fold protein YncE